VIEQQILQDFSSFDGSGWARTPWAAAGLPPPPPPSPPPFLGAGLACPARTVALTGHCDDGCGERRREAARGDGRRRAAVSAVTLFLRGYLIDSHSVVSSKGTPHTARFVVYAS